MAALDYATLTPSEQRLFDYMLSAGQYDRQLLISSFGNTEYNQSPYSSEPDKKKRQEWWITQEAFLYAAECIAQLRRAKAKTVAYLTANPNADPNGIANDIGTIIGNP